MRRLALLLLVALLVAGCSGGDDEADGDTTAAGPSLADLTSVDQLKQRFNGDRGVPRLIVLVAPT